MNVEPDFRKLFTKIALDVVCLLVVGVPVAIFRFAGKPYKRGFFCDDDSIRYPFHESTVPSWLLYTAGFGIPITAIVATEFTRYSMLSHMRINYRLLGKRIPGWVWDCYRHIGIFTFGAACSQFATDVGKYSIGRLRPHFFDICKPQIDCNDTQYKNVYIEKFTCLQKSERRLKDMRLSFPSGHSSFSAYCMVFAVMYLQAKMTWKGSTLVKHVIQFICLILAFYTALSRISDYKHHWSDVLAGMVLGTTVAVLIVVFVSDILRKPKSESRDASDMSNAMRMRQQ